MITIAVKKYFSEMIDIRTKNLLKNPAKGGTPAIENKTTEKVKIKSQLDGPVATQFKTYFGKIFDTFVA
jgi:hypothetical protein